MKTVLVMFDSLNRHMIGPYGGNIRTPNFDRLAKRAMTFDNHWVGSMPCMPARRDLLTGRLSFLHRSWGPLEPFDRAFPDVLFEQKQTYSHLATDHFHYWEDGGCTYHNRYDSYEFFRGQEGDRWVPVVEPDWPKITAGFHPNQRNTARRGYNRQDMLNRTRISSEAEFPAVRCFDAGLDFLEVNGQADNWYLQIETFSPHEPFNHPDRLRSNARPNSGIRDWPPYDRIGAADEAEAAELHESYQALVRLCDEQLGRVLDQFDCADLWQDTALIVTTDHGFLLGEHDFWAKNKMRLYSELAHLPLFVHDPRFDGAGQRSDALTQNIDIAPTLYDLFDVDAPETVQGFSIAGLRDGTARRDAAIYGYFGGAVNITDGRYAYHRFPDDPKTEGQFQYTLMPTHLKSFFTEEQLAGATLAPPFGFTHNMPLLKIPAMPVSPTNGYFARWVMMEDTTSLYDLITDPNQTASIDDEQLEERLAAQLKRLMQDNEAPPEAFERLGLDIV